MRNIEIPRTPGEYQEDLVARAFPEPLIAENDFYSRLIGWVADNRTPLLYDQTHSDEHANFSINFNWLLLRDYAKTDFGPARTILAMYAMHEFSHMTNWLPTRLDEITPGQYAQQFDNSEIRASDESEILLHYRVPELRGWVLTDRKIMFDVLKERGIDQPSAVRLASIRPLIVGDTVLDGYFGDTPENMEVVQFLKRYNGNRRWARERYAAIRPLFSGDAFPLGDGLTIDEYEPVISGYVSDLTQERYAANMVRNVRLGFAMCGLTPPAIATLADARVAVRELEDQHAVIQ